MAQAFRAYAKDLLEPQRYPDRRTAGGEPLRPYDVTGWTLPAQMGVDGAMIAEPFTAPLRALPSLPPGPGVAGVGEVFLVPPGPNDAFRAANRVLQAGGEVRRATAAFEAGGRSFDPGSFILGGAGARDAVEALARARALPVLAVAKPPSVAATTLKAPRIGLHKPWVASMDEGWTRWLLEQYEFPYRTLTDADVRKGGLAASFDVVVLADSGWKALLDGHPPGLVPPEYTGGLGLEGAMALEQFVEAGGRLVALDSAAELPVELFGLGVRNVLRGVSNRDYYCPGALLKVSVDTSHPLAWGLPRDVIAFIENSPAFEEEGVRDEEGEQAPPLAPAGRRAPSMVARFLEKDLLYSGWLLGESRIARKAVLVEAPLGRGRVVLVGFRSQFRGQPHGTFKVLFNALLGGGTPAS
jgi:hypothetical protein